MKIAVLALQGAFIEHERMLEKLGDGVVEVYYSHRHLVGLSLVHERGEEHHYEHGQQDHET